MAMSDCSAWNGLGIHEGEEPVAPVGGAEGQRGASRNEHGGEDRHARPLDAGGEDHSRGHGDERRSRAEVGLDEDQPREDGQHARQRQERGRQLVDPRFLAGQVRGQEEDEHRLGEFARLQLEAVQDDDPAMRAVDGRLEEGDDEPEEREDHGGVDGPRLAQPRHVDVHERQHQRAPGHQPDALPGDEVIRIVQPDLLRGDDGRGGVDHHHTDDHDQHGRAEEVGVVGQLPTHALPPRAGRWPRCQKAEGGKQKCCAPPRAWHGASTSALCLLPSEFS